MKRFALIFLLIVCCTSFCACSKSSNSSHTAKTNTASKSTISANIDPAIDNNSIAETTDFVVKYINTNYEEYFWGRYVDFGVKNLVSLASANELAEIDFNVQIIDNAIRSGENLSQKELEPATGAAKAIFHIDSSLFKIWYRATH